MNNKGQVFDQMSSLGVGVAALTITPVAITATVMAPGLAYSNQYLSPSPVQIVTSVNAPSLALIAFILLNAYLGDREICTKLGQRTFESYLSNRQLDARLGDRSFDAYLSNREIKAKLRSKP